MRLMSGTFRSTPLPWLSVLSNIEPPALRRKAAENRQTWDSWPIQPDILSPPLLWLTSRKPLWLDLQPVNIKIWWIYNWKSAQVVNSHLVCDPQSGNRVLTSLGNSGLCWTIFARNRDTVVPAQGNGDLQTVICHCGETQTMSDIVKSCPITKLNGGLSRLHSAGEDAVLWLTSYGSWHAYEKKKKIENGAVP